MPRQARLDIPGALHHIMMRGINKAKIFCDDQDRAKFLERLGQNILEADSSIFAWALLDNHVHLLFGSGRQGISSVMRKLLTWYAQYFNRRYRRNGHLFQNRYKSILCEKESYLLTLIRYIHLNPVRANIIQTIEELDCYLWSGHQAIVGAAPYPWMATEDVLLEFGAVRGDAIEAYRQFVHEGIDQQHDQTCSSDRFIYSHSGWSQVLSQRRKKPIKEHDARILGSTDFVQRILKEAEEKQLCQLKIRQKSLTIMELIEQEIEKSGVSFNELNGGSRRKAVSEARARIAWRCVEELGLSCAEIGRYLGVCTSSISRVVAKAARRVF